MKKTRTGLIAAFLAFAAFSLLAEVAVEEVSVPVQPAENGLLEIHYSVRCDELDDAGNPKDVYLFFEGRDGLGGKPIRLKTLTGDGVFNPVKAGGPYCVSWDIGKDAPGLDLVSFEASITCMTGRPPYLMVDLSGGPDAESYPVRYFASGPDVTQDDCRTTELWLRQIPAGSFLMGSPTTETGRNADEKQHRVVLPEMFYIGIFECTQRQWELVMGERAGHFQEDSSYATRPVECVSYNMIRGAGKSSAVSWPACGHSVEKSSFMWRLQHRTGLVFDLPTEAQWEYACRLKADGSCVSTALNSGKALTTPTFCSNMSEVGRYWYNGGSGYESDCGTENATAKVGSYLPNELGLYDMHGNVWEWCLDWYGTPKASLAEEETAPKGPATGTHRVLRGGGWSRDASLCRASVRGHDRSMTRYYDYGFRIAHFLSLR